MVVGAGEGMGPATGEGAMAVTCTVHQFDEATDTCKSCRRDFCPDCLVYTHGEHKPPYCIPCALTAAGVRSTAGRAVAADQRRNVGSRMAVAVGVLAAVGAAAVPVAGALGAI